MTLDEMKRSDKEILTASEVSDILKIHPSRIIEYGRKKELPFPVFFSGRRIKIPRVAFLNWMEGKQGE